MTDPYELPEEVRERIMERVKSLLSYCQEQGVWNAVFLADFRDGERSSGNVTAGCGSVSGQLGLCVEFVEWRTEYLREHARRNAFPEEDDYDNG